MKQKNMITFNAKKVPIKIDFTDAALFGNDAADLEQESLFFSYAVERTELGDLLNPDNAIQVIRGCKGEGKSALLRLVRSHLTRLESNQIVIPAIGPDHSPFVEGIDSDLWTREWKKALLKLVANEIGSQLGSAFTDHTISLVEEAEANGFRKRSFISAIIDRINIREVQRTRIPVPNHEQLVKRYLDGRALIWIVLDDIDQNFANTEKWRVKLGTFFTACRQIVGVIPELRIRKQFGPTFGLSSNVSSSHFPI
jgi:hypothetical protein